MEIQHLADLVERPDVQRRLLGDYSGSYSIGITASPADPLEPAIRVRVESSQDADIPSEIMLDGEIIPVVVNTQFLPPQPLPLRIRR